MITLLLTVASSCCRLRTGKVSVVTLKDGGARVAVKAMSRYTASDDSQVKNV